MPVDRGMNCLVTWNLFYSCEPIIIWTYWGLCQLRISHSRSSCYFLISSKQSLQDGKNLFILLFKRETEQDDFPGPKAKLWKITFITINIYWISTMCYGPIGLGILSTLYYSFLPIILRLCIVIRTLKWENWSPESKYNLLVRSKMRIQAQI